MISPSDERYWLESNWSRIRRSLQALLSPLASDVIGEIVETGDVGESTWSAFVLNVCRHLEARRVAAVAPDRGGDLWAIGLTLFGDAAPLRRALVEAGQRLCGDTAPAVRAAAIRRGLTNMRYRLTADSEHRAKTWSRLDAISRTLNRNNQPVGSNREAYGRCHAEHFSALAAHLREEWPHDRNLPRTVGAIGAYFEEFCADCAPVSEAVVGGFDDVGVDDLGALPDKAAKAHYLEECIAALDVQTRRFVQLAYRLGDVVELNVKNFCERENIPRRQFYRVLDQALLQLRVCLVSKIERELL